jgi:hypothetical protein
MIKGVNRIASGIDTYYTYSLFCAALQKSCLHYWGPTLKRTTRRAFQHHVLHFQPSISVGYVIPECHSQSSTLVSTVLRSSDGMHTLFGRNRNLGIVVAFDIAFSFSVHLVLIGRDTSS